MKYALAVAVLCILAFPVSVCYSDVDLDFAGLDFIIAVKLGNLDEVPELLDAGADMNVFSASGRNALIFAGKKGYVSIMQSSLDAGADVEAQEPEGLTFLMWGSRFGKTEMKSSL
jgi:ankyrin repeat protein